MAPKRKRADSLDQDTKKEAPAPRHKKAKETIETLDESDYKAISDILAFSVNRCYPAKTDYAFCGYSQVRLTGIAFPVLTREPSATGQLPALLPSGCRGYFLGASDPSIIALAIKDWYMEKHPTANPKAAPWENTKVWFDNRNYYGAHYFTQSGYKDSNDLAEEIVCSKQYGGVKERKEMPFARLVIQKKWQLAVSLQRYFAEKPPPGQTEARFDTVDRLTQLNQAYKDFKAEKRKTALSKKALQKKVADASEEDSSEEEDEEEGAE